MGSTMGFVFKHMWIQQIPQLVLYRFEHNFWLWLKWDLANIFVYNIYIYVTRHPLFLVNDHSNEIAGCIRFFEFDLI